MQSKRVMQMMVVSLALAACDESPPPPSPEPCPQPRGGLVLNTAPWPSEPCVIALIDSAGTQQQLSGCQVAEMVDAGDWTATLHVVGQPPQTTMLTVEPDALVTHTFRRQPLGALRLGDGPNQSGALADLDGKRVARRHGAIRPGVYAHPKAKGVHAVVTAGHCITLPGGEAEAKPEPRDAILIGGQQFMLDDAVKIVRFDQPGGLSSMGATSKTKKPLVYPRVIDEKTLAPNDLGALRGVVDAVVLYRDFSADIPAHHRKSLEQGFSSHFLIDFDGTIFQTADVGYAIAHSRNFNATSVAVDLNGGEAGNLLSEETKPPYPADHPRAAELARHPRTMTERRKINGGRVQTWSFTEAQHRSLRILLRALTAVFPKLKPNVPRDGDGKALLEVLADVPQFQGILGQHHISSNQWGPGPGIDWLALEASLSTPGNCWKLPADSVPDGPGTSVP